MTYKKYSMKNTENIAKRAASDIEDYLRAKKETVSVENVEDNPDYRKKDIDLIWKYSKNGIIKEIAIEIKGDRYYRTGNYFFETISNEGKGTPGCFLYTEANCIFYYFLDEKELHILPMPRTKKWFLEKINEFKERKTSTPVGNGEFYVTVGRLVPRRRVKEEVKGLRIINL